MNCYVDSFMSEVSSSGQMLLDCSGVKTLQSLGYGIVRDAFSLLQTDSSIKVPLLDLVVGYFIIQFEE